MDASGGAPTRARLPERGAGSRSNTSRFDSTTSGTGGVSEQGRPSGASSRPTSLGPAGSAQGPLAGGVLLLGISTPPRRLPPAVSIAPLLFSPATDPSLGTQLDRVAYLSEVARAVNQLQEQN
eukprot:14357332-Alexandrium_andersonii.AAC.1